MRMCNARAVMKTPIIDTANKNVLTQRLRSVQCETSGTGCINSLVLKSQYSSTPNLTDYLLSTACWSNWFLKHTYIIVAMFMQLTPDYDYTGLIVNPKQSLNSVKLLE